MMIRKLLPLGALFLSGVIVAVSPLRAADDPKPNPADNKLAEADKPVPTVLKVYDVGVLLHGIEDFPLASAPHAAAFTIPANRQTSPPGLFEAGGTANLAEQRARSVHEHEERIEQLVRLINGTVMPDTWRDSGGASSIRSLRGSLYITTTAAVHKEIADLLAELTRLNTRTVRTSVDWVVLPPGDVEKLLKAGGAGKPGALREVDPAALEKLAGAARHYHADVRGLNSQTVHFISGRERTVTVSEIAVVGTAVATYVPVLGKNGDGVALEVTPVVDYEENRVLLAISSTFNDGTEPGVPMTVRSAPAAEAGGDHHAEPSATYQELNAVVQEFRTRARLPLGVPVIVSTMTLEPSAKNTTAMQLVLIVKVEATGP